MREWKMQEWKLQEKIAEVKIAAVEEARVDSTGGKCRSGNTGVETYGKPSIYKFLMVEARIRMCLIANGRQSTISGKPNRTDWPGSWSRSHTL